MKQDKGRVMKIKLFCKDKVLEFLWRSHKGYENYEIRRDLGLFYEKKGNKIDLFDIDTKEFIGSTYILKGVIIKNGFAYKINNYNATNDFPKVEIYKIDPAVYGK